MKRSIIILALSLLATTVFSQGKFTVPSPTEMQKYYLAAYNWNVMYLIQISYAKSAGKAVEDVAEFTGDHLRSTWLKKGGFETFVNGMLNLMICMVPYGSVEIIEQENDIIKFKVFGLYAELKEAGTILNVTWGEYLKFLDISFSRQADYMGSMYSQKDTDDGLIFTLTKK